MTYNDLLEQLGTLSDEQLEQDVTIYQSEADEYWRVSGTDVTVESDVMDDGQFILYF